MKLEENARKSCAQSTSNLEFSQSEKMSHASSATVEPACDMTGRVRVIIGHLVWYASIWNFTGFCPGFE